MCMSLVLTGGRRVTAFEEWRRGGRRWVCRHGCLLVYVKLLEVWDGAEGEKKGQPPGPGVTGQFLVLREALSRLRI